VTSSYRLAIKKSVEFFSQQEIHFNDILQLKNESGFNNDWDLTQELLRRKNIFPNRNDIINRFQSFYWGDQGNGLIQSETWLLDHSLFKQLHNQYQLAIFTGRPEQESQFVLQQNQADSFFFPIIAMENVTHGKPNPEGLLKILDQLNISAEKACYFGDTFDDMRASKEANIVPVGVLPPLGKKEWIPQYLEAGAFDVLTNINELSHLL